MKNAPIEELGLRPRAYNCLKRAGINDTKTLIGMVDKQLLSVKGVGNAIFAEIVRKLVIFTCRDARGEDKEG